MGQRARIKKNGNQEEEKEIVKMIQVFLLGAVVGGVVGAISIISALIYFSDKQKGDKDEI